MEEISPDIEQWLLQDSQVLILSTKTPKTQPRLEYVTTRTTTSADQTLATKDNLYRPYFINQG